MNGMDISVFLEAIFLIAFPFCIAAAGFLLRRKFATPAAGPDGAAAVGSIYRKAARAAASLLFWGGIFAIIFSIIVILNFMGLL